MLVLDGVNSNFFWGGYSSNPGTCGTIHSITITTKKRVQKKGSPTVMNLENHCLHRKLTWNPNMEVWKMLFLAKNGIFRFQPLVFRGADGFLSERLWVELSQWFSDFWVSVEGSTQKGPWLHVFLWSETSLFLLVKWLADCVDDFVCCI